MTFALVFSGQGGQHPKMFPWLQESAIVRSMCAHLDIDDWRTAVTDPAWAERNANAQTLITGLAISAWRQIAPHVSPPSAIAGYSVGELAAFCAAGVYSDETALELSVQRARIMDACAAAEPGGLLAVTGAPSDVVGEVCRNAAVVVAIHNGAGAVVLGGAHAALEDAERELACRGVRCTRLRVGVASHTPLMLDAADRFRPALAHVPFEAPGVALFTNAADRARDAAAARQALADQIAAPVRWDECMENIGARRVDCVLEVGPGAALARMWNESYPAIPARSVDDFRSVASVVKWLDAFV